MKEKEIGRVIWKQDSTNLTITHIVTNCHLGINSTLEQAGGSEHVKGDDAFINSRSAVLPRSTHDAWAADGRIMKSIPKLSSKLLTLAVCWSAFSFWFLLRRQYSWKLFDLSLSRFTPWLGGLRIVSHGWNTLHCSTLGCADSPPTEMFHAGVELVSLSDPFLRS